MDLTSKPRKYCNFGGEGGGEEGFSTCVIPAFSKYELRLFQNFQTTPEKPSDGSSLCLKEIRLKEILAGYSPIHLRNSRNSRYLFRVRGSQVTRRNAIGVNSISKRVSGDPSAGEILSLSLSF